MESTIEALIAKTFNTFKMVLDVGRHFIDGTVVLRVAGTIERHEEQWIAFAISIPLTPTLAFFWERPVVEKDVAMSVLQIRSR